jgi:hypothetical protein
MKLKIIITGFYNAKSKFQLTKFVGYFGIGNTWSNNLRIYSRY